MLPQNNPDRIRVVFDDHRLVANAGLFLPATLAQHLGLRELVGHHLDLNVGIALEQVPVGRTHPDAVLAPLAAAVAAVGRGCGLTLRAVPSGAPWSPCRTALAATPGDPLRSVKRQPHGLA